MNSDNGGASKLSKSRWDKRAWPIGRVACGIRWLFPQLPFSRAHTGTVHGWKPE